MQIFISVPKGAKVQLRTAAPSAYRLRYRDPVRALSKAKSTPFPILQLNKKQNKLCPITFTLCRVEEK